MTLKKILKKIKLSEQNISLVLGVLVIIVIGALVFNYFRGVNKGGPAIQSETSQTGEKVVPQGLPTTHKVEKGENLWKIAEKYYGSGYNWVDIAKENQLRNANRLLVGQELTIPKTEVRKPQIKSEGEVIRDKNYSVQKGDSLWKISVRAYQDGYRWTEIAKANNLAEPNLIHPGNVLTLPQ